MQLTGGLRRWAWFGMDRRQRSISGSAMARDRSGHDFVHLKLATSPILRPARPRQDARPNQALSLRARCALAQAEAKIRVARSMRGISERKEKKPPKSMNDFGGSLFLRDVGWRL